MQPTLLSANLRPTAILRRETLALIRDLRFCLVPLTTGEYIFSGVYATGTEKPREMVEFLVYLMEARTPAQVLRALPKAAQACGFAPAFSAELEVYFQSLARTLKYNAAAFVIELPVRPAPQDGIAGSFPNPTGLPELVVEDSDVEPDTVICEADSTVALIVAA